MDELSDSNQKYDGMTTNERLFIAGLLDGFDQAVSRRDKQAMIQLLVQVELRDQAEWIADTLLARPSK